MILVSQKQELQRKQNASTQSANSQKMNMKEIIKKRELRTLIGLEIFYQITKKYPKAKNN